MCRFTCRGKPGFEADADLNTVDVINNTGGEAIFVKCDVSKKSDVEDLFKAAVERFGRVDIVAANAGIHRGGMLLHDMPEDYIDACLNINVKGAWFTSQEAVKQMLAQNSKGKIIITSSSSSISPAPMQAPYNISKAAVTGLAKSLAIEYGGAGINTNAICPTTCRTALAKNDLSNDNFKNLNIAVIPMGRLGESEDVANLALFLASDDSDFVNGANIPLDGGETLSSLTMVQCGVTLPKPQN